MHSSALQYPSLWVEIAGMLLYYQVPKEFGGEMKTYMRSFDIHKITKKPNMSTLMDGLTSLTKPSLFV